MIASQERAGDRIPALAEARSSGAPLCPRHYVHVRADGVYLQARMEPQVECMLVLTGAAPEGKKELTSFTSGMRASARSWKELRAGLKARGLSIAPEAAIGGGAPGFWKALEATFPSTRRQRCWLDKTLNVRAKLPRSVHSNAPTFDDFPAGHWDHSRTPNPIESVRVRPPSHDSHKRRGRAGRSALARVQTGDGASKTWRRLQGQNQLPKVIQGAPFRDGVETGSQTQSAA